MVAKLVAALALPLASRNIADESTPLQPRIEALDSGQLFEDAGVINMLSGDFFSWPTEDAVWLEIEPGVATLLDNLGHISFNLAQKNPASIRDLFKGIYEVFVPRELRHALGEIYTPDWLAAYLFDRVGWTPEDDLLDPTCGTGTFILEALKRRLVAWNDNKSPQPALILSGLYGIDLNPLAVLAAKASIVVTLSNILRPDTPIALPIYLADAINIASPDSNGIFLHALQTELGAHHFAVPAKLVRSGKLFSVFQALRRYIAANYSEAEILSQIGSVLKDLDLLDHEKESIRATVSTLHELHSQGWDGIWCAVLADRFAAGAIRKVNYIAGNPPWVKWSHLPPEYAQFIKPLCLELNAFSEDRYVGGIESDISTIITIQAVLNWLAPGGTLAFFITATLFSNESSQGFRRMHSIDGDPIAGFLFVEDFQAIAPFDGVTNHPSLMVMKEGVETDYPISYRLWRFRERITPRKKRATSRITSQRRFLRIADAIELLAAPVPGTDAGPWLKGTIEEHDLWGDLFDAAASSSYQARKGVTTDLNGVYFVRVGRREGQRVTVTNDPSIGRTPGLSVVRRLIEPDHIFPLMRGRGLSRFVAQTDPEFSIVVPQRGMHGDDTLPHSAPSTHAFFLNFKELLEKRGSYRRYQRTQPFWSTWSTGPYTFAPFKVLWKEMSGSRFCAGYVGSENIEGVGSKVVVPDHKLYFVPVNTAREAQYLTAILNARTISRAISAYAAQLSLGTSIIEYLKIPRYDHANKRHRRLAELAKIAAKMGGVLDEAGERELDSLAVAVLSH